MLIFFSAQASNPERNKIIVFVNNNIFITSSSNSQFGQRHHSIFVIYGIQPEQKVIKWKPVGKEKTLTKTEQTFLSMAWSIMSNKFRSVFYVLKKVCWQERGGSTNYVMYYIHKYHQYIND